MIFFVSKAPLTIQDVISQLPTKETMLNTMVVTSLLSNRATNQLGDFEVQYQYTPECLAAVKRFLTLQYNFYSSIFYFIFFFDLKTNCYINLC